MLILWSDHTQHTHSIKITHSIKNVYTKPYIGKEKILLSLPSQEKPNMDNLFEGILKYIRAFAARATDSFTSPPNRCENTTR